jgi:hypothetical protein
MASLANKIYPLLQKKYGLVLFVGFTLWNSLLIFQLDFFVTLDGPTHLYSSNILKQLLSGNYFFKDYFQINAEFLPNWTGHLLMTILNYFFGGQIAEKIIQFIIVSGLPLSFRYYLSKTTINYNISSYLIFPFVYGILFILGLYTFLLAVVLMFFIIGRFHNIFVRQVNVSEVLRFSIAMLLLYFTHLIIFGITLSILGLEIAIHHSVDKSSLKEKVRNVLKTESKLILATILPIFLTLKYYFSRTPIREVEKFSVAEIITMIKNVQPMIALNQEYEEKYTMFIGLFFLLLFVWLIVFLSRSLFRLNHFRVKTAHHLGIWLFIILLVFLLPDSDGFGWSATIRFIFLGYLFFISLISTIRVPKFILFLGVLISFWVNFKLGQYYYSNMIVLSATVEDVKKTSATIEENSVVLPINNTQNWLKDRISNYLSSDKPIVVLDNYQAWLNYFPIKWEENNFPNLLLGGKKNDDFECLSWRSTQWHNDKEIDYVFVFEPENMQTDTCWKEVKLFLSEKFNIVNEGLNHVLYKRK